MLVTNYPRGYTKVGFYYSQTEKIACKSPQNSSMFEIAESFVATSCHEIAMKSFTRAICKRHKNRRKNRRLNRRKNRLCKRALNYSEQL